MHYHIVAFLAGVILDWIIGDPYALPHPIRWIGKLISLLEKKLLNADIKSRDKKSEKRNGLILVVIVLITSIAATGIVLIAAYKLAVGLGIAVEAVLTCYLLCAKSLEKESMKVFEALKENNLEKARYAVSMIVGRDTDVLDEEGVTKAAVETVAENTSDGVIAPLIYTFIGGPVLGIAYKAANTMDSMLGYHNDKYEYFGLYPARLDDIVNYIPARISALLMILSSFILGKEFSGKNAWKIFKRDRYNHKSPNSAQTESVCAGALRVRLAGDGQYFGKVVSKPFIGDALRTVEAEDIKRACRLMFSTEILCIILCLLISIIII